MLGLEQARRLAKKARALLGTVMIFFDRKQRRHNLVGPSKLWKMKRDFQIDFLKRVGLKPKHFLIDIGCGTLRGGIPIIQYLEDGHYFGIESRSHVLAEGEKELSESGFLHKRATLISSDDIGLVKLSKEFDYIWAFSVLIHMTDDIVDDCLGFAASHLHSEGYFYANVNLGDKPSGHWQSFPVMCRPLEFYEGIGGKHNLRVEDIGSLKSLGHDSGVVDQNEQRMLKISKV